MTGPAALFEAHMQYEFHADPEGTIGTMVENPHMIHLGSGGGGTGLAGVREFYATKLIGQFFPHTPSRKTGSGWWMNW